MIRPLVALVATVPVATALGHAFVAVTVADQGWIEGFSSSLRCVSSAATHETARACRSPEP